MKVIVAHSQQQHSYRLAVALERARLLEAYCTTVYYRPRNFTSLAAKALPPFWRKKATGRHCNELPDARVIQCTEFGGLAVLFCHNIPFMRRWYWQIKRIVDDRFGRKVAKLAAKTGADAVVCYDGCSAVLFEEVKRLSPGTVTIADMSAANALYLKSVYELDEAERPEFAKSLHSWKRVWDPVDVARTERELAAADAFLCGSTFVERSLGYSNIGPDKCAVCHYGVDTEKFPYRERVEKPESEPLTFVYLGIVGEHKGVAYLFEAFEGIPASKARLVCVGAVRISDSIAAGLPANIELKGMVQHDEVSALLLNADVMLFPSLGDGFSLSIMEGFASGLPVVCSDNTGAADCVIEGENGFVVPTRDAAALRERIEWFCSNRGRIPHMAACARKVVLGLTWDEYYTNAAEAVEGLVRKVRDERK